MYLNDFYKLKEEEIKKLTKQELLSVLTKSRWLWDSNKREKEEADKALVDQSREEFNMKLLLKSYLGQEIEKDEYNSKKIVVKESLTELVGQMLNYKAKVN